MESLLKNLKQHLTCSICLDIYNEPKTISYHHTFCCECLSNHARASHRQGKFLCPECEALIDLPEENRFKSLPSSFFHNSLNNSHIKFTAASLADLKLGFIDTTEQKADANRSKLEGLDQILQAGVEAEFTLCPKTSEGELSNQADLKDRVEVLIEPQKDITDVMVSDKEDGNLQLKFTPKALGAYSIEVKINGDKLPTCPFTMQVKERELVVVGEVDLKSLEGNQPQGLHGIAVNTDGKMVVIDSNRHCVHVLDEKGNRLSKFGNKGSNSGQFKSPAGVAFLNDNEILVADQRKHRIQHINIQTGTVVKSFGKCGAGKDEVKHPVDVCLDDEGRIVVTDCDNHRIHVLSKEGETISIFGDRSPEKFNYPRSCIPYENMFFVSDGINICIKVNDQTGKFLYKFGKKGNQYGEFNWPCGMLVDRSNNLLVCDKYNVRVQQFSLDGRFTGKTVTHLPSPSGIATAPDGRILLTSSAANKVYILK
ncbi:uncharacterized protein LOC144630871 [Oculina patagonica]